MAEKSPEEQQGAQAELQKLGQEIGPLAKRLQELMQNPDASPAEKMKLAKRLMEILDKFRAAMPPEQFAEQFGQL
jgi:regulator of replication initiation timing